MIENVNPKWIKPVRARRRKAAPVVVRRAEPELWRSALMLALAIGGDARHLQVHDDGTVTVHNHPIR